MCDCKNGVCTCGGWMVPLARVLLALVFIVAGWGKLTGFAGAEQMVAMGGFPMPTVFTVLAIIFELGGGLMLLSGFHTRLGAWMLIILTVIATVAYHTDFSQQMTQIMFLKNVAIIGGLLLVAKVGAGAYGLSHWDRKICMAGEMCPDCKTGAGEK